MRYLLAPLDGFTDYKYRMAHYKVFGSLKQAVAPFVSLVAGRVVKRSHLKDLWPENNLQMDIEPQILGNEEEYFPAMASSLQAMGYNQLNWNLGCPMPGVAGKQRGAGLLAQPDRIDSFLDKAFSNTTIKISVKIRLGYKDKQDFWSVAKVLNKYPLAYVAIHPRTALQLYNGKPDWDFLKGALEELSNLCIYSGNIFTPEDAYMLENTFGKHFSSCMLGRGVLANPLLPDELNGKTWQSNEERLLCLKYLNEIYDNLLASGVKETLIAQKMKRYWLCLDREKFSFLDENVINLIKRVQTRSEYENIVENLWKISD